MNEKIEEHLGRIEQIETGKPLWVFGITILKEKPDILCISNRHRPAWIFSLFTGYRQIGTFKVSRPHNFKEGGNVVVKIKDGKILEVCAS